MGQEQNRRRRPESPVGVNNNVNHFGKQFVCVIIFEVSAYLC